jgi:uridine phosphorylase
MSRISETELILNADGSVYHLNLLPRHVADIVITVGDPGRVHRVSGFFDEIEFEINKREFITHTGRFNGKRITVISTGIGPDNIEIVLTELDALVNIDLKSRKPKTRKKRLKIVRIGTSGAIQEDIPPGSHLIAAYGIGLDNLMEFYELPLTPFEDHIREDIRQKTGLPFTPYVVKGSEVLFQRLSHDMLAGNTVTAPGFYAPQGRCLRISTRFPELLNNLAKYREANSAFRLTNIEMETAALYALGRLLGHEVISVNVILANRATRQLQKKYDAAMDSLIRKVLERI